MGSPLIGTHLFDGYVATVDWPGAAFWRELSAKYPDAIVLLSVRDSADAWWRSANKTIFEAVQKGSVAPEMTEWNEMIDALLLASPRTGGTRDAAKAAYEAHQRSQKVPPCRQTASSTTGPATAGSRSATLSACLCPTPFPHVNTTDDFRPWRAGHPSELVPRPGLRTSLP